MFEVKLAQNKKNEKVVCGSLLEFHRHRISSLIKRWTREQTKERWIMKKVLWMYQEGVMEVLGEQTEGVMDVSSDGS